MADLNRELFLSRRRLLLGPWQAFERDVSRLLLANGFDDVRIVGGSGDKGGDVLGVKKGELWVIQCKHTTTSPPSKAAVSEVVAAGKYYKANRLVVAVSRPPSDAFRHEVDRYERQRLKVEIATPQRLLNMMKQTPEYPKARRKLHDFQEQASNRFREGLIDTGKAQIVMATGLGKTVVMAEVVADLLRDNLIESGRVLVLAHTRPLVDQLHRAFWYQLPRWIATHQLYSGEYPRYWEGITFATVQSVASRVDDLPSFGLVLVDEAHHIGADTFLRTIDLLSPQMVGGVTATPWRGDGYDLDEVLGPPLVQIGIAEGLRDGFLCESDYRLLADNLDWEFVQQASNNNYSLSQLNRKLIIPTRDEEAARIIRSIYLEEHRNTGLVFSPTIEHAKAFAAMLRRYEFKAECISSELKPAERDRLLSQFRAGQLHFLTTVDLFNEGIDIPDVDLIAFMRATHSRRIFVQQLGRGLRISEGKDKLVVLDFVTDLRRIAEVLDLDRAARGGDLERLGLGGRLVQFQDHSAGSFLKEWVLDQASLILREGDPSLEIPEFNFPSPSVRRGIQ